MQYISKATAYNWRRLNTASEARLTSRANKTASTRRVKALSYLNDSEANRLLSEIEKIDASIPDIMYSLCCVALRQAEIINLPHVKTYLNSLSGYSEIDISGSDVALTGDNDVLGFIYQSLLSEGERNLNGIYYTTHEVIDMLLRRHSFAPGQTILDPCCGSGAFLMHCSVDDPECLHGFDIDPVAVMIASVNLLIKYKHREFKPQIFCSDYLMDCNLFGSSGQYDYIFTNPPWGADRSGHYVNYYPEIQSREKASMVIVNSHSKLVEGGRAYFILPTSLLFTSAHSDIRRYILQNFRILHIEMFGRRFDGVYTDFFAIEVENAVPAKTYTYTVLTENDEENVISMKDIPFDCTDIKLSAQSAPARSIIRKMEERKNATLFNSRFALGIVTGNNKEKLLNNPIAGAEPIFTGKEVSALGLGKPKKYIIFNRSELQQCAPDELYRAPEKLIYRFIAKYPIVAYDDQQSLCLNSANIIIPDIDSISVASVAALLNSSLYRFYYSMTFNDLKVLKGNLQRIPFPILTAEQNSKLDYLARRSENLSEIDKIVYAIFDISNDEQAYIHKSLS